MRKSYQYKKRIKVFLLLCISFGQIIAFSQDKTTLEQNKKKLEAEIAYNKTLLEETSKSKNYSIEQIVVLNSNINKREELITTLNSEIKKLDNEIAYKNKQIDSLENNLQGLRDDYAHLIRVAHKTENVYSQLAFIFAAEDFNQAFLRLRYLRQLTQFRRRQSDKIVDTQEQLTNIITALESQKAEKATILGTEKEERDQLAEDKKKASVMVRDLDKKEKDIKKTLAAQQKQAKNLERAIQKIIEEEIRKAAEASKVANASTVKSGDFVLTPAELALSKDFAANKGKLPWPVEKGLLSKGHGEYTPEGMKYVRNQNNGIDIMTNKGSQALAVFSGTVTRTWSLPGFNFIVMIRHGEYITVYSKLDSVSVKAGDVISTRQPIGVIHTDANTGVTEIHFELWKGKQLQNPSLWLAPF